MRLQQTLCTSGRPNTMHKGSPQLLVNAASVIIFATQAIRFKIDGLAVPTRAVMVHTQCRYAVQGRKASIMLTRHLWSASKAIHHMTVQAVLCSDRIPALLLAGQIVHSCLLHSPAAALASCFSPGVWEAQLIGIL